MDAIYTPVGSDLPQRLYVIQSTDIGGLLKVSSLDSILNPEYASYMKKRFNKHSLPARSIYIQMIFDCVNELPNYIRPYGAYGLPPL